MVTIKFKIEKATKNTFRFAEVENDLGPAPVVKTLYVQKWALPGVLHSPDGNIEDVTLIVTLEGGE